MALFQRKPQFESSAPLYSLGLQRTVLIIGLGNPGKEYDGTRHNIGFACADAFVSSNDSFGPWQLKKDLKCHLTTGNLGDVRAIIIKPVTFMNLSGEAVNAAVQFYKVTPDHIVAIHDELDIPFGQIRTRSGGSSAGHNGIKSLIQHLGEDFGRIRIGVGPKTPAQIDSALNHPVQGSADFVLSMFTSDEMKRMTNLTKEVNALLIEYIYGNSLPADTRNILN